MTMNSRQRRFVSALFECSTIAEAAARAGVSERSSRNYLRDPEVLAAIREADADALNTLQRNLMRLTQDAIQAFEDAVTGDESGTPLRTRAGDLIVQRLMQVREHVTIEDRLSELETLLNDRH